MRLVATQSDVAVHLGRHRPDSPPAPQQVALVNMPYASIERPSIQVALLKSIVERAGHSAETFHFNLDFVAALQEHMHVAANSTYETLVQHRFAAGDWFFAKAAFGAAAPDPHLMLDCWIDKGELAPEAGPPLLEIYHQVAPAYIEGLVSSVSWDRFDVVGFSSTFQQNVSSFALARQIKELHPDVTILFGGSNFDDEMGIEWVRTMPFIDYAIQGEAEESLTDFLAALADGDSPLGIPGVIGRRGTDVTGTPARPVEDLDLSPAPDYDEYFERLEQLDLMHRLEVQVPFESARGCWWGEKRHCTFCGLNGQTMSFRSKSPGRVLNELTDLALRHRVVSFTAVDNIMDRGYLDTLLPELAANGRPFRLFYETKADLSLQEIEVLVRGGVDIIQPGIESLSSHVLALMRKGTRAIWNVNMLRWLTYFEVTVHWNLLYGFPGEAPGDIEEQVDATTRSVHLQPPGSFGRVWLERFSPLFNERQNYPADWITPNSRYGYVYPDEVDFDKAGYFFDYSLQNTLPDEAFSALQEGFDRWRALWEPERERPTLTATALDGGSVPEVIIRDRRQPGPPADHRLRGRAARVHQACWETWRTPDQVAESTALDRSEVDVALAELVEAGVVFQDRNLYLCLALPAEPPLVSARPDVLSGR